LTLALLDHPGVKSTLRAWRELAWISAGQVLGALGAVVGVRLLTGVLTPTVFGELALGVTSATLAFQVLLGPLVNAYDRYYASARETGRSEEFFSAVRRLTTRVSLLILLIGVLVIAALTVLGQTHWLGLAAAAVAFGLLSGWESVLDGIQNAARQRGFVALHQVVRQWLRPILAVALLTTVATTSAVGMGAYAIASLLVLCSQFFFFRRTLGSEPSTPTFDPSRLPLESRMLSYATPFAIWGVFTWMQVSSDRWALQIWGTSADVGLYAIVIQLGSYPITLLGAMLTQVAVPIIFAYAGEGSDLRRITIAIQLCLAMALGVFCVTILLTIGGLIGHRQIFALLVGPEYQSASFLLPLGFLSGGLFVAGQMLSVVPMALGRSQTLLAPKILTALLAIVLNVIGAATLGSPGVLWAGLAFAICYGIWVAITARRAFIERRTALQLAAHAI
jgi:O-antigen/teichoic acid export membrane protein